MNDSILHVVLYPQPHPAPPPPPLAPPLAPTAGELASARVRVAQLESALKAREAANDKLARQLDALRREEYDAALQVGVFCSSFAAVVQGFFELKTQPKCPSMEACM
jgi:hypothetical protein